MTDVAAPPAATEDARNGVYRSILVPLDRSAIAGHVYSSAINLARLSGGRVHLLHVLDVAPALPPAAHVVPDGLEGKLMSEGVAELERWMSSAPDIAFEPPLVVIGDPWRTILHVAREIDPDLIVIGSHRYCGIDRILGTVAAKVVNHADRDVLVIHARRAASK